ncbi:MAG: hypothetical protein N2376_03680 [Clostridia bacterium]|nr:hypothetical protein [Clostridia bacterium]
MKHKLIILEGLPGCGKSTLSQNLHEALKNMEIMGELYGEGHLDHPADYEATACLTEAEYNSITEKYSEKEGLLKGHTAKKGDDYFVSFGKLWKLEGTNALCEELTQYATYGRLPWEREKKIMLDYWKEFTDKALHQEQYTIFECCFLQNQMCELMARFNRDEPEIEEQLKAIADIIRPLNPLIIYLGVSDVQKRLDEIVPTRPKEWLKFVIDYHTRQGYGLAHGLEGYEGLVIFYKERQRIEKSMLPKLHLDTFVLQDGFKDWKGSLATVIRKASE